ncbi:MAG: hypothetical protein ABIE94_07080 [archaeon]
MNLALRAFKELFPDKEDSRDYILKYSAKFGDYNGNIRYNSQKVEFRLSKKWKNISPEIQIGLIQSLILKMLKKKKNTTNIDLYNKFIKNMTRYAKVTKSDPELDQSFNRVNDKYFYGMIDKPNLKWGSHSRAKLGSYEYGSDTITISQIIREEELLLDYVMYHEILHKKHKFYTKDGRSYHHTSAFRKEEKAFEDPDAEKKLKLFLAKKRITKPKTQKKTWKWW